MKVEVVATIAATPATIWQALIQPKQIAQWFAKEAQFDARVGKSYRIEMASEGGEPEILTGRVAAWVPEVRLSFSVSGPGFWGETVVTYFLSTLEDGTKLTIVHDGFKRLAAKKRGDAVAASEAFWAKAIAQLVEHLGVTMVEGTRLVAGSRA